MKKYKLIKSPVEPSGLRNPENYIWLKYTPVDETEEVSPKEDGYYVWVGTNTWIKVPFMNGEIDKSLIPDEFVTDDELSEFVRQLTDLVDSKSTVVAPMYLNLPDASLTPYTPRGGVWNHTSQTVIGEVVSTLSDGSSAIWKNNNEDYTEGYYTWFTFATFEKGGNIIVDWMTPICIRIAKDGKDGRDGIDGMDGVDGHNIDFVFRLLTKEEVRRASNYDIYRPSENDPYESGFVPSGWKDHPTGIDEDHPIELMCFRRFSDSEHKWSNFVGPTIWSQWGEKGKDGDGVEYIFRLARLEGAGAEASYNASTGVYSLNQAYWPSNSQDDDYVPDGWSDDVQTVDNDRPVQFVSKRKYDGETREWGEFTEPVCFNKLAQADIEINVSMFTAFAFAVTKVDLSNATLEGGSVEDPEPEITRDANGQIIEGVTWYDTRPNSNQGSTWMTTRTFKDGEPVGEWSTPIKLTDSIGFQVEYSNDYPWATHPALPNFGDYAPEDDAGWRAAALAAGCGTWKDYDPDVEEVIFDPTYMATCQMKDDVWSDWVISKIKGENGMSSVIITNDNIMAPVTVREGDNTSFMTVKHTLNLHAELGNQQLEIDANKIFITSKDEDVVLPNTIEWEDPKLDDSRTTCTIEIKVLENTVITEPIALKITVGGDGYSQDTTFTLLPITSANGCTYEIKIEDDKIDRAASDGTYTPAKLKCKSFITEGTGGPTPFGTLKYSVSDTKSEPLLTIGDVFNNQQGIIDFLGNDPSDVELEISSLTGHAGIRKIFVYLLRPDNIVVDVEDVDVENSGLYELRLSTNNVVINSDNSLSPNQIKIQTLYKTDTVDKGTVIENNTSAVWYRLNDSTDYNDWNKLANNAWNELVDINSTTFTGFDTDTINRITFAYSKVIGTTAAAKRFIDDPSYILAPITSIVFTRNGKDGESGSKLDHTVVYYMLSTSNSAPEWSETHSHAYNGGSYTAGEWYYKGTAAPNPVPNTDTPFLWRCERYIYEDGSVVFVDPIIIRYYNESSVSVDYSDIEEQVIQTIDSELTTTKDRLAAVEGTVSEITSDGGITSIINSYSDESKTVFADIVANAVEGVIEERVGAAVEDSMTSVGTRLNAIDASITSHASSLSTLTGEISSVNQEMSALEGHVTTTVSKATYCWYAIQQYDNLVINGTTYHVVKDLNYPYAVSLDDDTVKNTDKVTAIHDGEDIDDYENRIKGYTNNGSSIFEKRVITSEMSAIKQESHKISLLVGEDGQPSAGIQIIGNAATNNTPIVDPVTGETISEGSVIVLDSSNVVITGGLSAGIIKSDLIDAEAITADKIASNAITADKIAAGAISANTLETGSAELGTTIANGVFKITYNGATRVAFGMEGTDVVLIFYDENGYPIYNLGPNGIIYKRTETTHSFNELLVYYSPGLPENAFISNAKWVFPTLDTAQSKTIYQFKQGCKITGNITTWQYPLNLLSAPEYPNSEPEEEHEKWFTSSNLPPTFYVQAGTYYSWHSPGVYGLNKDTRFKNYGHITVYTFDENHELTVQHITYGWGQFGESRSPEGLEVTTITID